MRKFMTIAVLATAFLGATACGTTAGTPSGSPSPTVSLADIKTSCGTYAATQVKYLELASASTSNIGRFPGTDSDKAEVEAFIRKLVTDMQQLIADLKRDMALAAAQAGDPAIRAELTKATEDLAKLEEQLAKAKTMDDILAAEFVSPSKADSNADKKIKELCRQAGASVEETMVKLMTK